MTSSTKKLIFIFGAVFVLIGIGLAYVASTSGSSGAPETDEPRLTGKHIAEITVRDYGTITVELDGDTAPITVANFVKLANEGFYDGLTFHRIISGFMIQGGCPEGTGRGGSDTEITGEFEQNGIKNDLKHTRGVISMARSKQPNSASSHFFICHADAPHPDGAYASFGIDTEGIEVVDAICADAQPVDNNGTIPAEAQPVIESVKILD
ncbi:MAG: peptidylprolyl isomerase [Clostridia bacterium]|nr:peptidylprolyl isomerase [Clostridia bacterium]